MPDLTQEEFHEALQGLDRLAFSRALVAAHHFKNEFSDVPEHDFKNLDTASYRLLLVATIIKTYLKTQGE